MVAGLAIVAAQALAHGGGGNNAAWNNEIGQIAGQGVAQDAQYAADKACREGAPASPEDVERAHTRIEKAMSAYFSLTPKSSTEEIEGLFSSADDTHWRDGSMEVPIGSVGPHLGSVAPQRTLLVMVVGGDDQSARAIWSTAATVDAPAKFYGGDFVNKGWLGGWKIWHLSIFDAKPDTPPAYCHFIGGDQSF
jgi:hypothetical protein